MVPFLRLYNLSISIIDLIHENILICISWMVRFIVFIHLWTKIYLFILFFIYIFNVRGQVNFRCKCRYIVGIFIYVLFINTRGQIGIGILGFQGIHLNEFDVLDYEQWIIGLRPIESKIFNVPKKWTFKNWAVDETILVLKVPNVLDLPKLPKIKSKRPLWKPKQK